MPVEMTQIDPSSVKGSKTKAEKAAAKAANGGQVPELALLGSVVCITNIGRITFTEPGYGILFKTRVGVARWVRENRVELCLDEDPAIRNYYFIAQLAIACCERYEDRTGKVHTSINERDFDRISTKDFSRISRVMEDYIVPEEEEDESGKKN